MLLLLKKKKQNKTKTVTEIDSKRIELNPQ